MRPRYLYAAAGAALGLVAAVVMLFPILVVGQFYLKANHGAGSLVSCVSWAVLAFFAGLPPATGYAIGRKKELQAPPAQPAGAAAAPGAPSALQLVLGGVGAVLGAVFAYVGSVAVMICSVFILPRGLMKRIDDAPALAHEAVFVAGIALVVLAGWAGSRIGSSLGRKS